MSSDIHLQSHSPTLNPAQQEAITHGQGPLLIIAGAGTGKTKVLTSRIMYLLQEQNIPADQIVALTFTEKATREMQDRLDEALPLLYNQVTIKTFHGFCDQILRERGLEIGIDPGYTLLTQSQQWYFVKQHLFAFELEHYRPLGNPSKFLHILLSHFSRLKDQDISPEQYLAFAQAKIDQLEAEKLQLESHLESQSQQSDSESLQQDQSSQAFTNNPLVQSALSAHYEDAKKRLEIAKAYQTYQQLLQQEHCLDFNDLIFYVLRLFEQRPSVLQEYQERFRYILVDEFQDTNDAQYKLLMMLGKKYQNITVVGDDDQSIYKWRGASSANMELIEKAFPQVKTIVLTQNYRSTQSILDLSYAVIQHNNPYRLEVQQQVSKRLTAQKDEEYMSPEVWHFDHYLQEIKAVVNKIEELIAEGVPHSNIALLFRANSYAQPFIEALKNQQIPLAVRESGGILKAEEIKDLIALLRFVHKPHDNVALFRLLSLPLFDVPMSEVLALIQQAKDIGHMPVFYYLRQLFNPELQENIQPTLPGIHFSSDSFEDVYQTLENVLHQSRNASVQRIIGIFLETTGYAKALTKEENAENLEKLQRIAQFSDYINEFEQTNPQGSLESFLDYIESLEGVGGGSGVFADFDHEAVSILTVHSAKGLEFDYVFIPSLVQHRFPAIKRREPIEIPEELAPQSELNHQDQHLNEERRLFYVACTRARKGLFLSYSNTYEGRKQWKISPFLQEAIESKNVVIHEHTNTPIQLLDQKSTKGSSDSSIASFPTRQHSQLSYSKLDAFDTCPLKYKFRYIFEIATPTPHAANFGSSVHNTVHEFYKALQQGQQPSLELIHGIYEQCWIPRGYESRGHERKRKEQGKMIMEKFFHKEKESDFKIPFAMEKPFQVRIGPHLIKGRIDRIDQLEDGSFEIIDYKTGTSKRETDLRRDLQLTIYLLACQGVGLHPVSKLSLYFLEDATKLSIDSSELLLEKNQQAIVDLADALQQSEFNATPGKHCDYCDYRLLCKAAL